MYTVNPFPPPFGVCSICQKHDCGVSPEGEKWIQIPLELFVGGDIHIGYKCIKSMSDNMMITQDIIEREVLLTPTDEQIGDYVRKAVNASTTVEHPHAFLLMDRDELKAWFKEREIPFTPQWGEDRLREEALKHV